MISHLAATGAPMLPWWVVVPLAGLTMLVVAWHTLRLRDADIPASRRRIRTANGLLMLAFVPVLAFAVGVANPGQPRTFALAWVGVIVLLIVIITLAGLDMLNTLRLYRAAREELARQTRAALGARGPARDGGPGR